VSNSIAICPMERWSGKGSESAIGDAFIGTDILSCQHSGSRHLGAALSFLECRLFLSYRDLPKRLLMCGRTRQYRIISLREE